MSNTDNTLFFNDIWDNIQITATKLRANDEKELLIEASNNIIIDTSDNFRVNATNNINLNAPTIKLKETTDILFNQSGENFFTVDNRSDVKSLEFFKDASLNTMHLITPSTLVIDPSPSEGSDNVTGLGKVVIRGNLQVTGTRTIVNSTIVEISDTNLILGSNANNLDLLDGAGLMFGVSNEDNIIKLQYDNALKKSKISL